MHCADTRIWPYEHHLLSHRRFLAHMQGQIELDRVSTLLPYSWLKSAVVLFSMADLRLNSQQLVSIAQTNIHATL